MTQTLGNLTRPDASHTGAVPDERSVAGALRNLAYAAIRPLRYRMHYQRIFGELAPLDDEVLCDIGLARWDIGAYAHQRAALRWPVRASLRASLSEVTAALWQAVKRDQERRRAIKDLMMLDDRALKDIGLSRCQVPWIIEEMIRCMSDFDDVATARGPVAGDDERTDIRGKLSLTPASIGALTASRIEMPANDDRVRKAS